MGGPSVRDASIEIMSKPEFVDDIGRAMTDGVTTRHVLTEYLEWSLTLTGFLPAAGLRSGLWAIGRNERMVETRFAARPPLAFGSASCEGCSQHIKVSIAAGRDIPSRSRDDHV